jgi:hypothetical protein
MPSAPPPEGYDSSLSPLAKKIGAVGCVIFLTTMGWMLYTVANPSPEMVARKAAQERKWFEDGLRSFYYFQDPDTRLCFVQRNNDVIRTPTHVPCTPEVLNIIKNGRPNDR